MGFKTNKVVEVSKDIIDAKTGEFHKLTGNATLSNTHSTIKKLNGRFNMADFSTIQMAVATSPKRLEIFWELVNSIKGLNIYKRRTTLVAEKLKTKSDLVLEVMRAMAKHDMAMKIGTGHYMFNPYMVTGKEQTNYELEAIQAQWTVSKVMGKFISIEQLKEKIEASLFPKDGTFIVNDTDLRDIDKETVLSFIDKVIDKRKK